MTASSPSPWLNSVRFRRSKRARRLHIRISPRDGVLVTVPPGMTHERALAFVRSEQSWIEHHLARLPQSPPQPPESLPLPALGEIFSLETLHGQTGPARLQEQEGELLLQGNWREDDRWCDLLRNWLRGKARERFPALLADQAQRMQLYPRRVSIRLQRTRWGSCNRHGDISLNARLLLLEPGLLNHVLIHELAHLRHLNHSPAFWSVVASADPHWRQHRQQLRNAALLLPDWLER